ncbi:DUF1684 domain-containing protein [Terriglobus sp. RCC_193]|uniref:DUF1684 domain-containing protein n=1 Tax=Terriglobus sp. RCC_193 TaxID=3239218 RepID=UPI003526AEF3
MSLRRIAVAVIFLLSTIAISGCHRNQVPPYSETEEMQFRADEARELAGPRGDLALIRSGLMETSVSLGKDEGSSIRLPNWSGPPLSLTLHGMDVVVEHSEGNALLDGKPLVQRQVLLLTELSQQWITNGGISLRIHKEGQGAWLQVFDAKSEPLQSLHPLHYYAPSPEYRVTAEWIPLPKGYHLTYHRTNGGNDLAQNAPGYVRFSLHGQEYRLYATTYPDMLFVVFRDLTSKTETYPAARYLEIPYNSHAFDPKHPFDPAKRTKMALDFNQAVNPACAYNPNTHCPIAPPENRLPVAIPAGEKRYTPESE